MTSKPISPTLTENRCETLKSANPVEHRFSTELQSLVGVVKLPKDFDEKQELYAYFENKHLRSTI